MTMRSEIKNLHQRLKTTTVYVTHDQIGAMTMADKIVVMHDASSSSRSARRWNPLRPPPTTCSWRVHRLAGDEHDPRHTGGPEGFRSADGVALLPVTAAGQRAARTGAIYGLRPELMSAGGDIPMVVEVTEPTGGTHVVSPAGRRRDHGRLSRPRHRDTRRHNADQHRSVRRASVRRDRAAGGSRTDAPSRRRRGGQRRNAQAGHLKGCPFHSGEETFHDDRPQEVAGARPRWRRQGRLSARSAPGAALARPRPASHPKKAHRLLCWVPLRQGEEEAWNANAAAFTAATGVRVTIDQESWGRAPPRPPSPPMSVSGPDMVMSWFDDPFQYPDKLVDVTDLCTQLGEAHGGWYDGLGGLWLAGWRGIRRRRFCAIGNAICYRDSHMKAAGFDEFPTDTAGLPLETVRRCTKGHARGLSAWQGGRRRQQLCALAALVHGGKRWTPSGKVAVDSAETLAAIDYAKSFMRPSFRHGKLARHQQQPRLPAVRRSR